MGPDEPNLVHFRWTRDEVMVVMVQTGDRVPREVGDQPSVSQRELARRAMHRAVNVVIAAWPLAIADAAARGYPTSASGSGDVVGIGSVCTDGGPTARTACTPAAAVAWLAELFDVIGIFLDPLFRVRGLQTGGWSAFSPAVISERWHMVIEPPLNAFPSGEHSRRRLYRLADMALRNWPPSLAAGDRVGGVTVGGRTVGGDLETCGLCAEPVAGGAADPIRRIDGVAFHKSPCWYRASLAKDRHPTRVATDDGRSRSRGGDA